MVVAVESAVYAITILLDVYARDHVFIFAAEMNLVVLLVDQMSSQMSYLKSGKKRRFVLILHVACYTVVVEFVLHCCIGLYFRKSAGSSYWCHDQTCHRSQVCCCSSLCCVLLTPELGICQNFSHFLKTNTCFVYLDSNACMLNAI